ncbi:MAG TPA: hypothetical protein VHB98_07450, partial [Chloroflexota bacterium]|nr:hypothetical protein [Chloroflexota bacterium]
IPTMPDDASLNLAQAALLMAYELFLADAADPVDPMPESTHTLAVMPEAADDLATGAELEAMFDALHRMLEALHGTLIPGRTKVLMARVRALLLRAAPRTDEVALLTQLFEHIAHRVHPRRAR